MPSMGPRQRRRRSAERNEHFEDDDEKNTTDRSSVKGDKAALNDRDEIREVEQMAQRETNRIRTWRVIVAVVILSVGLAVTFMTYSVLREDEDKSFETAYEQFSSAAALSARTVQSNIKEGYQSVAEYVAIQAVALNMTWPFVILPEFESFGKTIRKYSSIETVAFVTYVEHKQRHKYVDFISTHYVDWVRESHRLNPVVADEFEPINYYNFIKKWAPNRSWIPEDHRDFYYVLAQQSPPPTSYDNLNFNTYSVGDFASYYAAGRVLKGEVLTTRVQPFALLSSTRDHDLIHNELDHGDVDHRHSYNSLLIRQNPLDLDSPVVGVITGPIAWDAALRNLLPDGVRGIHAVIQNNCNDTFTYVIDGADALFVENGDHHDRNFNRWAVHIPWSTSDHPDYATTPGHCMYNMTLYPSSEFHEAHTSSTPQTFAILVASSFVLMAIVFFIYDMYVQQRNHKLVNNAARSNAIVTSLFPEHIRDQFIGPNARGPHSQSRHRQIDLTSSQWSLTSPVSINRGNDDTDFMKPGSRPIADLFLETTILFGDIVGFTAWSSVREPAQVFSLLETIYASFDRIARKTQVFKVETIGDCYVAVCGLPEPRDDHAVVMVRFARCISQRMYTLTRELEVTLGPDTGDLSLRIGIHSGPVTAGVLRGDRARFQLFGDTMNTTARIETHGLAGRVHISQDTADLLVRAGKGHWLTKRKDVISAKGKPDMQTYWVQRDDDAGILEDDCMSDSEGLDVEQSQDPEDAVGHTVVQADRKERLIDWSVETLVRLIKQVAAGRKLVTSKKQQVKREHHDSSSSMPSVEASISSTTSAAASSTLYNRPLDEIKDIIVLPEFNQSSSGNTGRNVDDIVLPEEVVVQLRQFVSIIASMYRANPFHNFEHASHVTMSVIKMLSRVVAPTDLDLKEGGNKEKANKTLHDHTYGITSDPLTQLACAVTALIHDVDHVGVSNAQLIKEEDPLVATYGGRSVLEQNSFVLAWDLFMDPRHELMRKTICENDQELAHFRQLLVNGVMATDIVDKELKNLRNQRWEKAFSRAREQRMPEQVPSNNTGTGQTIDDDEERRKTVNRKATIVIEHLIQASDVSHTMQHWHVYRKWNESFFRECYAAYQAGRSEVNPAENWYKGEIGFFDFYVIPLARKLKDCGVFGKCSDEFLNYALANRREWELRGQIVVAEMIEKVAAEEKAEMEKDQNINEGKFEEEKEHCQQDEVVGDELGEDLVA